MESIPRLNAATSIVDNQGRPLGSFLRWCQDLAVSTGNSSQGLLGSFLLISPSSSELANSRALSVGAGLFSIDTGPGGSLSLGINNTSVLPGVYGSPTSYPVFTVNARGQITSASTLPLPSVRSGVFTPVVTGVTNIATVNNPSSKWTVVDNIVTVFVRFDAEVSASDTPSSVRVTLPIPTSFSGPEDAIGSVAVGAGEGSGVAQADVATGEVELSFSSSVTTNIVVSGSFSYTL